MIPVEGHKGLFRDEQSNAIINCDDYEYEQYRRLQSSALKEKQEIESLKKDVEEIKLLLLKFLEKNS